MTIEGLKFINQCMEELNVPYEFMEWTRPLSDLFFVGEYTERENQNEDGLEEATFILTGTTTNKYMELESVKDKIKKYFGHDGKTAILESGSGIAVCYSTAYVIPTDENEMHRIQINLDVKEWRC